MKDEVIFNRPKKRVQGDIKLLRLEISPQIGSLCEESGLFWDLPLPEDSLSLKMASKFLNVHEWDSISDIQNRFQKLMERYPRDIFPKKYLDIQPSYELLSNKKKHYNWYWLRGIIPSHNHNPENHPEFLNVKKCLERI